MKLFGAAALLIAFSISCFGCAPVSGPPSSENSGSDTGDSVTEPTEKDPSEETPSDDPIVPPGRYESTAWAENFTLPNADEALSKLSSIYGGAEKVFLLQKGKIARMPCPQGETITLNMTYEAGEYTRLILEDSVAEFNEVFSVINPNYRFTINYSPTETDYAEKYSVRMSASDNLAVTETSQVFGLAHIGYYANFTELGDFGITIKSEVLNNGSYLMTTFKHELMHLLGAGDAYQNANATKATVMQSYRVNGYHFLSGTDVAFLDALYRNPELNAYEEEILDYIGAYEETATHTQANLTAAVYQKLVDGLSSAAVTEQAAAIGYKDITEFSQTIKDGIGRNEAFGKTPVSFKEIEYAETPTETYYGSIDPQKQKYWHGRQTTVGSAQGIGYTDYGKGILYAKPNGSLYTILIQTGDFVLAFRLYGSFTDFAALSLDLWHVSR